MLTIDYIFSNIYLLLMVLNLYNATNYNTIYDLLDIQQSFKELVLVAITISAGNELYSLVILAAKLYFFRFVVMKAQVCSSCSSCY